VVAQRESPAIAARKRAVRWVRRKLPHSGFSSRCNRTGISRSCLRAFPSRARATHTLLHWDPRFRTVCCHRECSCGSWLVPRAASLCIRATSRLRGRPMASMATSPSFPSPVERAQLHHLREDVVHRSPVPFCENSLAPQNRLRPAANSECQISPEWRWLPPPTWLSPAAVGI